MTVREESGTVHTFAGGVLDRAAHLRADDRSMDALLKDPESRFLPFRGLEPLVGERPAPLPVWLPRSALPGPLASALPDTALFLGLEGGTARFAVALPADGCDLDRVPGAAFRGVRDVAPLLPRADASTLALGRSLVAWHESHRHCPACGARTVVAQAGHVRRCVEDGCGRQQFPRTDPVVIMLIHADDRCLLGRAVRTPRYPPGMHSCLAGYVEPGESIEEAVRRETREEAGIDVGPVRYHSSQPWPFPSTLMIGCFARTSSEELRIDPEELESARWFTRSELREAIRRWNEPDAVRVPPPLTIAHQLALAWLEDGDR